MVLAITAYIMIIAVPVIGITASSAALSRSSGDMECAYYISEAGIERSADIIADDICSYMSTTDIKGIMDLTGKISIDDLKEVLDGFTASYFMSFRNGRITGFQRYAGGNGKDNGNGTDTILFSSYMLFPSYYNISSILQGKTKLGFKDGSYIYDIPFNICVLGNTKNACREIKAKYVLSVVFNIPEYNTPEEIENAKEEGCYINIIDCRFTVNDWQN